ncbi:hypothetical protein EJ04DRAFT_560538 [Polyplosphaeria fusca]|uniref:Uncharacterized protein n=1 Tax=Polyplosphaeria fusca TaxID=682080 RepID=A0A9P4R893_9PLEO|nr:hypothetical protein EJ04DRAFT_560538 [Polyplosphaeria fusca]
MPRYTDVLKLDKLRTAGIKESFVLEPEDEVEETKPAPARKNVNLRDLIEEAEKGDPTVPERLHAQRHEFPAQYLAEDYGNEEYNPNQPLLNFNALHALGQLLNTIRADQRSNQRRTPHEATRLYEYDPHLLEHMLAGATYTASLCRRCENRRPCRTHRQSRQFETSVSLCPHKRMYVYWAPNDPVNRNASWKLEVKDFTVGYPEYQLECRRCRIPRPSQRVSLLTERLIEDMRKKNLRPTNRRVSDEIFALVSAWEFAKFESLQRRESTRVAEVRRELDARKAEEERQRMMDLEAKRKISTEKKAAKQQEEERIKGAGNDLVATIKAAQEQIEKKNLDKKQEDEETSRRLSDQTLKLVKENLEKEQEKLSDEIRRASASSVEDGEIVEKAETIGVQRVTRSRTRSVASATSSKSSKSTATEQCQNGTVQRRRTRSQSTAQSPSSEEAEEVVIKHRIQEVDVQRRRTRSQSSAASVGSKSSKIEVIEHQTEVDQVVPGQRRKRSSASSVGSPTSPSKKLRIQAPTLQLIEEQSSVPTTPPSGSGADSGVDISTPTTYSTMSSSSRRSSRRSSRASSRASSSVKSPVPQPVSPVKSEGSRRSSRRISQASATSTRSLPKENSDKRASLHSADAPSRKSSSSSNPSPLINARLERLSSRSSSVSSTSKKAFIDINGEPFESNDRYPTPRGSQTSSSSKTSIRKRSCVSTDGTTPRESSSKRVRFTPDVEALPETSNPRRQSARYDMSDLKKWSSRDEEAEDEVDYEDGHTSDSDSDEEGRLDYSHEVSDDDEEDGEILDDEE